MHLVAFAIMVVLVAVAVVGISGDQQLPQNPERLQKMINEHIGVVMGGDQVLFVLVVLLAVGLRLGVYRSTGRPGHSAGLAIAWGDFGFVLSTC
ncbi:MAG: hypothetical protein Ct9H300mP1_01890 [Planctomycetaceae bacterium]|nr:MAG: hypothetical protein Ct9H300mP1_01890 [Planctomycetaceae bacterium]